MKIRKATMQDVSEIVGLWEEFMGYHQKELFKKDNRLRAHLEKKKNSKNIFKDYVEKCISSEDSVINVAEDKDKLIGYSLMQIKNNIPIFRLEKIGNISDIFIKKDYRGKKLSSMFKKEAIKWFKKKGIKYMSLQVYPGNEHAKKIYSHWGFFDFHIEMRRKI